MSIYNTGNVKVIVGSATVKGNSTDFVTSVSAGDYFRLTSEAQLAKESEVLNKTSEILKNYKNY